jgi:glycosyltransferase involved in cell wall biosynthesis
VREAMMLGKPVICFLRPEWLESMRDEIPDYVDELPVISATPHNIEEILRGLILDKKKREAIGQKSREFALKWHSSQVAARRFNEIYTGLLAGESLLRKS